MKTKQTNGTAIEWPTEAARESMGRLKKFLGIGRDELSPTVVEDALEALEALVEESRGAGHVFTQTERTLTDRARDLARAWRRDENNRAYAIGAEQEKELSAFLDDLEALAPVVARLNESKPLPVPSIWTNEKPLTALDLQRFNDRDLIDAERHAHTEIELLGEKLGHLKQLQGTAKEALSTHGNKSVVATLAGVRKFYSANVAAHRKTLDAIAEERQRRKEESAREARNASMLQDPVTVIADLQRQIDELQARIN